MPDDSFASLTDVVYILLVSAYRSDTLGSGSFGNILKSLHFVLSFYDLLILIDLSSPFGNISSLEQQLPLTIRMDKYVFFRLILTYLYR
jgi:hypothetical protein